MAEKVKEDKVVLEREYIVPLRRKCSRTPRYKRTPRAIKILKEFLAKHMKVDDRDTRKIKIDNYLNLEMWSKGIRKPLIKVKVKAKKFESGIVRVELVDIPEAIKWKMEKAKKLSGKVGKKEEIKPVEEKKEKTAEEKKDEEEKQKSEVEASQKIQEQQHKELKHVANKEKPKVNRMALQK
ncbi:MAG: 50S ribosomal protein L31e [Nanoarchaeota archaeon]